MAKTCQCEHPQSQHKLSKGGCRALDCYCAKFVSDYVRTPGPEPEPDDEAARAEQTTRAIEATGHLPVIEIQPGVGGAPARDLTVLDTTGWVDKTVDFIVAGKHTVPVVTGGYIAPAGTEPTSAALRRVEQERDEAVAERNELAQKWVEASCAYAQLNAELASARTELDAVKAQSDAAHAEVARANWIVARDGGRSCERCEQEVRRGEAYEPAAGTGGLIQHIHCPDPAEPALWQYKVWFCQPATGCGQRYNEDQPTHECGPLTAALVTITRISEEHETA